MATLGKMDADQRKAAGAALNLLKDEIDAALRALHVTTAEDRHGTRVFQDLRYRTGACARTVRTGVDG
jgi:hypothetical protein